MSRIVFALSLLLLAANVLAQPDPHVGVHRYRWADAQGQIEFSDQLPAEAILRGYDVVNHRGLLIRHVAPPLSQEEQAVQAEAQAKAKEQQRLSDLAAQKDQQLLAAYPTEQLYAAMQQEMLENIDQQIRTTELNLKSQEKSLADLLAHAGGLQRAQQSVPQSLRDSITTQKLVVADQRVALARLKMASVEAVKKVEADLEHYRTLSAHKPSAD